MGQTSKHRRGANPHQLKSKCVGISRRKDVFLTRDDVQTLRRHLCSSKITIIQWILHYGTTLTSKAPSHVQKTERIASFEHIITLFYMAQLPDESPPLGCI